MKSLEELREFCDQILMPDLKRLENIRLANVRKMAVWIIPIIVIAVILAVFLRTAGDAPIWILMIAFVISAIAYGVITKGYVNDFKEKIIARIIEFIDPKLSFSPSGYISSSEFKKSKIFSRHPDRYKGDDRVTGKVGVTDIDFSEVHAQYVTRDSKGRTQYHTIFKGLFFIGDFNKHFNGKTFVLPDRAEKLFGGFGKMLQSWNSSKGELIKLEDPEFEKLFVAYGSDQTEARYILSPSLMKRIVDFKKKSNRPVYISFIDSNVYIAISYIRNLFEPRIFQTLLDFRPIQQYFEDLQLMIGIVEDLNLNTRIWSKA